VTRLTDFLLARIAEDEAMAKAAIEPHETDDAGHWEFVEYPYEGGSPHPRGTLDAGTSGYDPGLPWSDLVNRYDPARVLAECEAKRQIVERAVIMARTSGLLEGAADRAYEYDDNVLPLLALPYADHPDYREEWRP
jgi:hypothetical protein